MRLLTLVFLLTGCVATTPTGDWSGAAECPPSDADVAVYFSLDQADADLARGDGEVRWDSPWDDYPRMQLDFDLDVRVSDDGAEEVEITYSECIASFGTTDYPCPLDGGGLWTGGGAELQGSLLVWAPMEDYVGFFDCSFHLQRESNP